jgi:phage repressor protein C with HTH and peptisase S24 domain
MTSSDMPIDDRGDALAGVAEGAAEDARTVSEWKTEAAQMAAHAAARARSAAASGRERTAEGMQALAQAARERAARMDPDSRIADLTRSTADGLERASASLKDFDLSDLAADARAIVRDHPAIAAGIAVAGGFALAQLIKAVVSGDDA